MSTNKLVGKWTSNPDGHVVTCVQISSTTSSCNGNPVTWHGGTVILDESGLTGTYDIGQLVRIIWSNGRTWEKEGTQNILYQD